MQMETCSHVAISPRLSHPLSVTTISLIGSCWLLSMASKNGDNISLDLPSLWRFLQTTRTSLTSRNCANYPKDKPSGFSSSRTSIWSIEPSPEHKWPLQMLYLEGMMWIPSRTTLMFNYSPLTPFINKSRPLMQPWQTKSRPCPPATC